MTTHADRNVGVYVHIGIPLNRSHAILATKCVSICGFLFEILLFAHVLVCFGPRRMVRE